MESMSDEEAIALLHAQNAERVRGLNPEADADWDAMYQAEVQRHENRIATHQWSAGLDWRRLGF